MAGPKLSKGVTVNALPKNIEPLELLSDSHNEIRSIVSAVTTKYMQTVLDITLCPIDDRLVHYLRSLHKSMPLDRIVIGQSPYSSSTLACSAAALATNTLKSDTYPVSITVMSQFLELDETNTAAEYATILSNSHVLLEAGFLFVNVLPVPPSNDSVKIKLVTAFVELVRSIIATNYVMGCSKTLVHSLGEEAYKAATMLKSSLKPTMIKGMTLSYYRYKNPVYLARRFNGITRRNDILSASLPIARNIYTQSNILNELSNTIGSSEVHSLSHSDGHLYYGKSILKLLGSPSPLRRDLDKRAVNFMDTLIQQYLAKQASYIAEPNNNKLEIYTESYMKRFGRPNDQFDAVQEYARKSVEFFNKTYVASKQLADELESRSFAIEEKAKAIEKNMGTGEDIAIIKDYIESLKSYVNVARKSTAFYAHIPVVTTQIDSMLKTGGATTAAILRTGRPSDNTPGLEFIDSIVDVAPTHHLSEEVTQPTPTIYDTNTQSVPVGVTTSSRRGRRGQMPVVPDHQELPTAVSEMSVVTSDVVLHDYPEPEIDLIDYETDIQQAVGLMTLNDKPSTSVTNTVAPSLTSSISVSQISRRRRLVQTDTISEVLPNIGMVRLEPRIAARRRNRHAEVKEPEYIEPPGSPSSHLSLLPDDSASVVSVNSVSTTMSRRNRNKGRK